jgi:hypothetical protein
MMDTIQGFIDALNEHQVDRAMAFFVPDARVDAGSWSDRPLVGRTAIKNFLGTFVPALPGLRLTVTAVYRSHSEAVVTVEVHATMSQLNPDPAHIPEWKGGRKVVWSGAFHVTFTGERQMGALRIFGDATELRWVPSATSAAPGTAAP